MTARIGEPFETARAVADVLALLDAPVPAAGPTAGEGEPVTGEWTATRGEGFVIVPLWESEGLVGVYERAWTDAEEAAQGHLDALAAELAGRWGPGRRVAMHVPLFRKQAGEPLPPLFQALCDEECYGDLSVWGPVGGAPRWVGVSVNQCDGDAPMILVAVVSDRAIVELPGR
ncbi:hypothetical protein ACIOHE_14105 [Streptomyces sp. NPDC087851]|uniref:hypothetical protein n=1 Tax=Streptomyces sp. NPDC087851 TaxID=3365810 RepID=UPI00380EFC48